MKKYVELMLHLFFFGVIFYITFIHFDMKIEMIKLDREINHSLESNEVFYFILFIDFIFKAIFFYLSTQILIPKLLKSKNKFGHIFRIIGLFTLTLGFSFAISTFFFNENLDFYFLQKKGFISFSILIHTILFLLAFGYRSSKDSLKNEALKKQAIQEKLQTELHFLKAQINPHFLFNTLNNLYAESRKHPDKTVANGIAKLSHMMRYMIHDSNVAYVTLVKEIQHLESFIELQKMRIDKNDPIDLKLEIEPLNQELPIIPIIFIPFVENAFKHGLNFEKASFIHIFISTEGTDLIFKVSNSKFSIASIEEHSGFGLQNVKKRLNLLYPEKHELYIRETEHTYNIELKLMLN